MSDTNLDKLKASLDIVTVGEMYGELEKQGANYRYREDHSIVINPAKQIFSNFNGDITGGSVLDLVMYMEKCDVAAGIKRLKELAGQDTYHVDPDKQIKRKKAAKKKVDLQKLGLFAKNDLHAGQSKKPFELDDGTDHALMVNPAFTKLFERSTFPLDHRIKFDYLHRRVLGHDEYFRCPSIIIRDAGGTVVDKCAYRPQKPDHYEQWSDPKYIYKNPTGRGERFLYPFQAEVEKIIEREHYLIVGEGLKNALNALLYGAPFISTESTSNAANPRLIDYIRAYRDRGYGVVCMYDGDAAGRTGFDRFREQSGLDLQNHLDFDSGQDFTSYMVGGAA